MKIALDTNVLAYAEGTNGTAMRDKALKLILQFVANGDCVAGSDMGELFNLLVRKAKRRPAGAAYFCRKTSRKASRGVA